MKVVARRATRIKAMNMMIAIQKAKVMKSKEEDANEKTPLQKI